MSYMMNSDSRAPESTGKDAGPTLVCLALACLTLFQVHAAQIVHLSLGAGIRRDGALFGGMGYCLGVILGAAGIDLRRYCRLPLLLLPLGYAVGVRLFLFDDWQAPAARFAAQAGTGFLVAAALWVFFELVPRRRAATLYFACIAVGFGLAETLRHILYARPAENAIATIPYNRLLIFTTILFALALAPAIVAAFRHEADVDNEDEAARWKTSGSLLLLVVLLFLLHGLLNSVFLPYLSGTRARGDSWLFSLMTVAAYGLCAWLFSRDFVSGIRLVAKVCGIVLIAAPAFSLFPEGAVLLGPIRLLAGMLQNLLLAAVVIGLALAAPRRWRVVLTAAPFVIRVLGMTGVPRLLRNISPESEVLPLAAVLVALAFYVWGRRMDLPALAVREVVPEVVPDVAATSPLKPVKQTFGAANKVKAAVRLRKVIETVGKTCELSEREEEVALLLVSGLAPDAIGKRLKLTKNTVNTYVRRIVIKSGCDGRHDFIAKVKGMADEEA